MELEIKLQVFEGPLDLLIHFIDNNKVNIFDIPIVLITKQYMEYVNEMPTHDLDVVSEFMVMAATLLDIKAKMLLPKEVDEEGEEIDPRQELVEQLLQYKMYKYASYELKDMQGAAEKSFYRKESLPYEVKKYEPPTDISELIGDLTLQKLHMIFNDVMKRQKNKIDPIRSKFGKIEREEVSLSDKMDYIVNIVHGRKDVSFFRLLSSQESKMHVIVSFLAVLELMKVGKIVICQEEIFDDIIINAA